MTLCLQTLECFVCDPLWKRAISSKHTRIVISGRKTTLGTRKNIHYDNHYDNNNNIIIN